MPQFQRDWRRAVAEGFIEPERQAGLLELITEILTNDPYRYPLFPVDDQPVDMRWFDLYGSRRNPRVEIWYSVLEDDRLVHLVAVVVIYAQPQG